MYLYLAGTALAAAVGALYVGIKAFCPWILADLRYIGVVIPYVKKYQQYSKKRKYLIDVFEEQVAKQPGKTMIIWNNKEYSYKEVNEQANRLARAALHVGLKKGDTVAIMIYNEPAFIWTYLAMMKIGVIMSMINTNLRGKPLQHCISVSSTTAIIVGSDKDLTNAVTSILPELPELTVYTNAQDTCHFTFNFSVNMHILAETESTENIDLSLRSDSNPKDPIAYIFTSGTTGLPKAAYITNHKTVAGFMLGGIFGIQPSDRIFVCLPLYHSSGLLIAITSTIAFGATCVLEKKFSKSNFLNICREHGVTVMVYIGELCRYLLTTEKSDMDTQHSIRLAIGNGLRQDVFSEFKNRFKIGQICEFYASTEGSAGMVNFDGVVGACGRISPFLGLFVQMGLYEWNVEDECLVRDNKGHCIRVPFGTPGLLLTAINQKQEYQGYKGRKDLTESKIVKNVVKDGDIYFNTGDLMVQDRDYNVYFNDRVGDTFRWKGENVSTTEVSNFLTDIDFVIDAYVYGVTIPGCDGRAGMSALVVSNAQTFDDTCLKQFHQHCKECIPVYARPLFLRVHFDELDMTSTLKQNKVRLKKEGYDVSVVSEDLYYYDRSADGYKPLTKDVYAQINRGDMSF